jgi:hypothetical protein
MSDRNLRDKADALARSAVAIVADAASEETSRLTSEIDSLKALVSEMIIKAEPFAKLAETFERDLSDMHPLAFEVATNDNMIDFYLGDLRSLSKAVRKAKETVGTR